jgi:hypothetical protein
MPIGFNERIGDVRARRKFYFRARRLIEIDLVLENLQECGAGRLIYVPGRQAEELKLLTLHWAP